MTLLTVTFDRGQKRYKKLHDVFMQSLSINSPGVKVESINREPPEREISMSRNCTDNSVKLNIWYKYAMYNSDDLILSDCDMLNLRDCSGIFDHDFDVAVTFASDSSNKAPMNGGLVAVKNTKNGRDFIKLWLDVNNAMYKDRKFHQQWQSKYLGMNQAAFGYIYERELDNYPGKLIKLPTKTWNSIDTDWKNIDNDTIFVHIKSELRHAVLNNIQPTGDYYKAMVEWYKYRDMLPSTTDQERNTKGKPRRVANYRRPRYRGRRR